MVLLFAIFMANQIKLHVCHFLCAGKFQLKIEEPEAKGKVIYCCVLPQIQPAACDDGWSQREREPREERDKPPGTYLGDSNDNHKQVCN